MTSTHGLRVKLSRPLDWIAVTDHSEMYGLMPQLLKGDPEILATEKGRRWYDVPLRGEDALGGRAPRGQAADSHEWKTLVTVGNDPYPYSSAYTPTLVFEGVEFAGD